MSRITLVNLSLAGEEAQRVMNVCNACRYCEGFCPVFPAMTQRTTFDAQSLDYLANLCHNCTACYHACQYKPPHEFQLNVPLVLAEVRIESYQKYAWPRTLARSFSRNGLVVSLLTALVLILVMLAAALFTEPGTMNTAHQGSGAFYAVVSHGLMVTLAGGTFGFATLAMLIGAAKFWRAANLTWREFASLQNLRAAVAASATLEHLGGGQGQGCNNENESFSNQRRYFHQLTMWGFLFCFAATCVATVYELWLGKLSPFPYLSLPVLLGTAGGFGLMIGTAGLGWLKRKADSTPMNVRNYGMDYALLAQLFLISLTGMLLLCFRETATMGVLLIIHLGFVLAFFLTMPYSKFIHGIYRFAALVRYAHETKSS